MVNREVHAPRTPALVMVVFDRQADGPVVDDGDHLGQVLCKQPVKQHLVAVVQSRQVDVLAERIRQPLVLDIGALDLRLQRADIRWEQTRKTQLFPLFHRKGHSLVQQRRVEDSQSASLGLALPVPILPALRYRRQQRDNSLSHGNTSPHDPRPRAARPLWRTARPVISPVLVEALCERTDCERPAKSQEPQQPDQRQPAGCFRKRPLHRRRRHECLWRRRSHNLGKLHFLSLWRDSHDGHPSELRYDRFIRRLDRCRDFERKFCRGKENGRVGQLGQFYRLGLRIDEFLAPLPAGIEPGAQRFRLAPVSRT